MSDRNEPQMNSGENPSQRSGVPEAARGRLSQLQRQYQFLETLVALTISALILMSLGLNLFLFKQMRLVRGQLHNQKQVAAAVLEEFHNKREPAIKNFVQALQRYGAANPEFSAIMEKYRPYLGKYFSSAVRPAATTPNTGK